MTYWKTVVVMAIVAVVVLVACGPAAQPTAVPPAPKQAPAVAPTAAPAPAAAKPVESAKTEAKAPAPAPAAKADPAWKTQWDGILAAAKKEGKVVVSGPPGDTWRNAAREFGKAYPEIQVDWRGAPDRDQVPKIVAEQKAGLFLWDLHMGGAATAVEGLKASDAMDPLTPALILPDVLDTAKWRQGFDEGWMDKARQIYAFQGYIMPTALANRNLAPASELKLMDDLLEPKYKGKIAMDDPRRGGPGQNRMSYLIIVKGEAWVRKLLSQDITPLVDSRQMLEGIVRGRFTSVLGIRNAEYMEFKEKGLANHIDIIEPDTAIGQGITHGSGAITMLKKAPNANAAKVFLNWLLGKEGQAAFAKETQNNSRRVDVDGPPEGTPKPGVKYIDNGKEEYLNVREVTIKAGKDLLK